MYTQETYQFICKACGKGYRGLVKFCPHCGIRIRPDIKTREHTPKDSVVYQLPPDYYLLSEERYDKD